MTQPIFAVGDIHGQYDMLQSALARITHAGGEAARIVFVGDLVDRGPASRAVIERLIQGQAQGHDWTVLMGNHDRLFVEFLDSGAHFSPLTAKGTLSWLNPRMGGDKTLASYGVTASEDRPNHAAARAAVPPEHRTWLAQLPTSHLADDMIFVHAGIRPEVPLADQNPDDLVWIREPFLSYSGPHPHLVVHGHTALDLPQHHGNRVNLDSGAGYGRPITAARFHMGNVSVLTATGEIPLLP